MSEYKAVINTGDHNKLIMTMDKARRGEDICVAFIGGSITEGYSSTSHDRCYAKLIHDWWADSFPDSNVRYVNAGIGGTCSDYGAARVEKDVLVHRPDVVFVDFSVNDEANEFYFETYEGLIRRLLLSDSHPAVVLIHFVQYDSGVSAQEWHLDIGRHYALPCISLKDSLYMQIHDGVLKASTITADMLHPNDEGHRLIASLVTEFLEQVRAEAADEDYIFSVPAPLSRNAWEGAVRLQHADTDAALCGFEKDTKEKEYASDHFRGGWYGKKAGDEIVFKVNCSEIAVQFRRTVKRPAPIALAIVDGDEDNAVILDANFDQDWGDCLSVVNVMRHGCVVGGQTEAGISPAGYGNKAACLARFKDDIPQAAEHELKIRIIGTPDELGWKMGKLTTGGPAWHKGESNDSEASFDLLSLFVSSPSDRDVIRIEPSLMERIWGGSRLKTEWGYDSDKDTGLGECWAISANDIADNTVSEGRFKGWNLSKLWKDEPQLFVPKGKEDITRGDFPLLIKIIDAKEDLSIQVHPDDGYAARHGNGRGKSECWYILDCPEGAELIIGNRAKDKEELARMINEGRWDELLNRVAVKKGDFIQLDPGTLHAITAGVELLEIQENSDLTYRIYDYGRLENGKPRRLNLEQGIEVIDTPDMVYESDILHTKDMPGQLQRLIDTAHYSIYKLTVDGEYISRNTSPVFKMVNVIEGEGTVEGIRVRKGDHLIIPALCRSYCVYGRLQLIVTEPVF